MGEPEGRGQYVQFEADDLAIYVARPLLERLEERGTRMRFYITGYGRFWLAFDRPPALPAEPER